MVKMDFATTESLNTEYIFFKPCLFAVFLLLINLENY